MPTTTYLQNGSVLTSSALLQPEIENLFQIWLNQFLGILTNLPLQCNLTLDQVQVSTPLIAVNLAAGFIAESANLPEATTIVDLTGEGSALLITLSNPALDTVTENVYFSDPVSQYRVRIAWQFEGAPAWKIDEDILSVQCTEDSNPYDLIRDSKLTSNQQDGQVNQTKTYTRVWRITLNAYGPNSFDSLRVIKSLLLTDFSHDMLQLKNLFVVPALGASVRSPEYYEGQWWERADFSFQVYEAVTEVLNIPTAKTVEVIASISTGQVFDETIMLQE